MSRTPNNQAGFTLIEMMVVVFIIGLLASMIAPTLFSQIEKAEQGRITADFRVMESQLKFFYLDNRRFPTRREGLEALVPTYFSAIPTDPYGNPYIYKRLQGNHAYVATLGADGRTGGDYADTDRKHRVAL